MPSVTQDLIELNQLLARCEDKQPPGLVMGNPRAFPCLVGLSFQPLRLTDGVCGNSSEESSCDGSHPG